MKIGKTVMMLGVLAVGLAFNSAAGEGKKALGGKDGGPIQHILEHAKDLNLSAEQKTKLAALAKESAGKIGSGELREKFKDNPEAREMFKAMKEARDSGDEAKMAAAREKMRAFMAKNGGPADGPGADGAKGGEFRLKVAEILTPEQMLKVKELMENARGKLGGDEPKGQKPDTSKEAPKVFE